MPYTFPVKGQGVFLFKPIDSTAPSCSFRLTNAEGSDGFNVEFTKDRVAVTELVSQKPLIDPINTQGLSPHKGATYWFSVDAQNKQLIAGVGEARLETLIYWFTFRTEPKTFLESITTIDTSEETVEKIRILKDPITSKIATCVKGTDEITMDDIASGAYMPKANLPPIGRKLYDCIAGKQFVLNSPDFPEFSQAIEHSIRTPGLWCYNKLRDKSTEFNPKKPNLAETYLRITLGQNNGESPGIPYVMEIWPVGHFSPIHSHANANAIIRVLWGQIHVSLYPFLCAEKDSVKPFASADFKKEDITWITPTLNQTHQLKNLETNADTCITIQCYMYSGKDTGHYDYFDYLDEDGKQKPYEPDSDMDFLEFKKLMKKEWAEAQASKKPWWFRRGRC
jgi:hypothetical protein